MTQPENTIRAMTDADYPQVVALWRQTEGIGLSESDSPTAVSAYLQRNPGMSGIAVLPSGQIVGAVLCGHDGRRGYLTHLAVAESHRRQGIGRALVEHAVAALQREGIIGCNLFVWNANQTARQFWESMGWQAPNDWGVMNRRFS